MQMENRGGICAVFVKRLYVEKCVKIFMQRERKLHDGGI